MTPHEEDLQRRIEGNEQEGSSADAEAYRFVFRALERETDFELSSSFQEKVIRQLAELHSRKESLYDRWVFAGGLIAIAAALIFCLTKISFKPGVGVFTFLSGYSGLVIFGLFFILLLHFAEKKWMKRLRDS